MGILLFFFNYVIILIEEDLEDGTNYENKLVSTEYTCVTTCAPTPTGPSSTIYPIVNHRTLTGLVIIVLRINFLDSF